MILRTSATLLAILSLAVAPLGSAVADSPPAAPAKPDPDTDKTAKLMADLTALTTSIEALREKPSDTVGTNGGEIEAALLSSDAINSAADKIAGAVKGNEFVVVGQSDVLDIGAYLAFAVEVYGLDRAMSRGKGPAKNQDRFLAAIPAITTILPLLSSLLRSETEVSGIAGALTDDRLLVLALAGKLGQKVYLDKANILVGLDTTSPDGSYDGTNRIFTTLDKLGVLRDKLDRKGATVDQKALVARYDAFLEQLTKPAADGTLRLTDVLRGQALAERLSHTDAVVVRVHIEKTGGTLLKRKNLAVALGASALGISAGIIASYSATQPGDGRVLSSGTVTCTTAMLNFRQVHQREAKASHCRLS